MSRERPEAWIGTSGWNYPHWSGLFYPKGMGPSQWFRHYASRFDTVEVNSTFYRLPDADVFVRWKEDAPAGFRFALKASRFIIHVKRLLDPDDSTAEFLNRSAGLRSKLGPVLFQMPPGGRVNLDRLQLFLAYLGRQEILPGLKVVLEAREPSWLAGDVLDMLRKANVALCLADWPDLPVEGPITAGFVYVRRHGAGSVYAGSYPRGALQQEAERVKSWLAEGRSVYVYFNNDAQAHAIANAIMLKELLS